MAAPPGVSVAFTAGWDVVSPAWTRLDTLPGCRVQSWTVSRGRPSEFEQVAAGTASIRIIDLQGLFDPTNGASPYFPNVLPDRQAAISLYNPVLAEWQSVFRGFVDEWSYTLDPTRQFMTLELELVDLFGRLVDYELMPGKDGVTTSPSISAEGNVIYGVTTSPASRIVAILDDVGVPTLGATSAGLRDIFSGNVSLTQATYPPGTDALSALFDTADAEFPSVAVLYVNREGILTFHGRQARFRPDVAEYGIRRQTVGDPSLTDSDATVCPVHELGFALGKSNLFNSVQAYPQHTAVTVTDATAHTGTATPVTEAQIKNQLLEDAASIAAHGKKSLSFTDLLTLGGNATGNTALAETLLYAQYYRDNYKTPLPRVNRMVFKSRMPSDRLAGPLWRMLTRADISDRLTLTTDHPGAGGFTADDYYVEGLRYQCEPANNLVPNVELELDVSPAALFDVNPFAADPDP